MRTLILICRLIVGSLFIVSGLIKANDPLGFSYKLEEYFAESALNMVWLEPWALALAILACLAEIVLGFAVLFGGRMKITTWALLLLTLFFGWLTAYTATCDPHGTYTVMMNGEAVEKSVTCVTDCGCFGDAMKGSVGRSLTPWESFAKDMILLVFVIPLFIMRKRIGFNTTKDDAVLLTGGLVLVAVWSWIFTWAGPVIFTVIGFGGYLILKRVWDGEKAEWATALWIALLTIIFTWYAYTYLPPRDYRPYAEGRNIAEQKTMGKPPVQQIFMLYKNKTTGQVEEFDAAGAYPWDDENFEYVDRRIVEKEAGIVSPVQDFLLSDVDGNDITNDLLAEPSPLLLIYMYNVRKADTECMEQIKALADTGYKQGWYVYGVSASPFTEIEEVRHEHQLPFDFLQADEKVIKTAIRSNPGIMLLQQGTVKGNWSCAEAPSIEEASARLTK
jgi:uncharacterized membrane protein YphA (DoxX/SURF4 family)/peroxiredoxin